MKNNIKIPQDKFIKHFRGKEFEGRKDRKSELDVIDMIIYDFFYGYCASGSKKIIRINYEGYEYKWAAHSMILKELPTLHIKKDALRNRIHKLVNAKLIDRVIETVITTSKNGKVSMFKGDFYKMGEKSDCIHYTLITDIDQSQEGVLPEVKGNNKETGNKPYFDQSQGNKIVCNKDTITDNLEKDIPKCFDDTDVVSDKDIEGDLFYNE